jgi:hypothetical protein
MINYLEVKDNQLEYLKEIDIELGMKLIHQ